VSLEPDGNNQSNDTRVCVARVRQISPRRVLPRQCCTFTSFVLPLTLPLSPSLSLSLPLPSESLPAPRLSLAPPLGACRQSPEHALLSSSLSDAGGVTVDGDMALEVELANAGATGEKRPTTRCVPRACRQGGEGNCCNRGRECTGMKRGCRRCTHMVPTSWFCGVSFAVTLEGFQPCCRCMFGMQVATVSSISVRWCVGALAHR